MGLFLVVRCQRIWVLYVSTAYVGGGDEVRHYRFMCVTNGDGGRRGTLST